ncbi:MAG TPA: tetratricopeptide repeat protein [Gemmatimonadota bacterium]|nr:tetratricopeptide repeat protein [Gemmatimonadota bacterium]
MRRFLIVAVLIAAGAILDGIDAAYAQTATAIANGAKVRIQRNKFEEANELLGREIQNYPESAELHYLYAITLARIAPEDSASKAIGQLAIADSLNGEPAEGGDEEEIELQENIDQAIRSLWGGIVNDGVRSLTAGDIADAEAKLTQAVRLHPQGKEGHLGMGAVHQAKEEYDLAIAEYRRALEIDPSYKNALLRLGQSYQLKAEQLVEGDATQSAQALELAGEATKVYEDYLATNPGDVEVQIQLAGLHASLGHMDQAEPIIREVMAADSVEVSVYTDFGFRLANAGQYDLADELLSQAVTMSDSLDVEPLSYLAFVRIQKKDLAGAKIVLDKQVALDPSNAEAWEYLGYVRRDLGDEPGALEAFEKAEGIPLELQQIALSQDPDMTWNVDATFVNRLETPVSNVQIRFSLISETGEVIETQEAAVAGQSLAAGEGERVTVEFTRPAENPRVRYEIL